MRLAVEPDEHFWGGVVEDGESMPYRPGAAFDTRTSVRDNQVAPILLSDRGRYAWSDGDLTVTFEVGAVVVEGAGPVDSGRAGGDLRGAFLGLSRQHFPATGAAPPAAMFTAPQWNTWIELVYDQTEARILEYAEGIVDHGYPAGVLMIDDNWQEDYGVWKFHPARFADPTRMVARLHELGFTVMLWTCPFVSPDSAVFRDLERRGLLLRDSEGLTAMRRWWNGVSAVLDLTHPAAVQWYHEQLRGLQDRYGVDGFKFDAGDQRFYRAGDRSYTGADPNGHCAAFAAVAAEYAFTELRSGWAGGGRAVSQRLTDALPVWGAAGLASLVPRALAQGLAGYAFNCPDMVGGGMASSFEQDGFQLDEELFVRWAQCSALFPMVQFSLAPWRVLSADAARLVQQTVHVRQRHLDRILELVGHAAQTGEPVLRHLEYVFPHQGYHQVNDQFLLGDDVLVAPVLEPGRRARRVVIPPGHWRGDDGEVVSGPAERDVDAPLDRLPHFVRRPSS